MKNILVAVDFSGVTDAVMDAATKMGRALGADVCLVHVASPDPDFLGFQTGPQVVRDQVAHHWHEEHRQLQSFADTMKQKGINAKALLIQGMTADKILEEAAQNKADLIILGSHGHGALHHVLLGSVSEGVLKKAPCPVLVVPSVRRA